MAIYLDTGDPARSARATATSNLTPAEAFPDAAMASLNVVLMNPEQWKRFCGALGDEAMETDPRFATNDARLTHHAEFKARVEAVLATAPIAEWVARLEAATVAAGPVYEFHEVFEDPQVRHLRLVAEMEQPGAGRMRILGFPGRASATQPRITRPAPLLGQHTGEALGELGLSREEIDRLAAAGVVELGAGRPSLRSERRQARSPDDDVASDHHGRGRHARRGSGTGGDAGDAGRWPGGDDLAHGARISTAMRRPSSRTLASGSSELRMRDQGTAMLVEPVDDLAAHHLDQGASSCGSSTTSRRPRRGPNRLLKPGTILVTIGGLGNAKQVQFRRQGVGT